VNTQFDLLSLQQAGFDSDIKPRRAAMVQVVEGLDKTGKTHYSLTAPGPIVYQSTDFGHEGVIQKFANTGKAICVKDYKFDMPTALIVDASRGGQQEQAKVKLHFQAIWETFARDYDLGLRSGARTVVWDNGGEVWEIIRLMVYGRESPGQNHSLTAIANAYYRDTVRKAVVAGVNLIIINQLKPGWEGYTEDGRQKWRKSGEYEAAGNDKDPYLVSARLRARFVAPVNGTPGRFEMEVRRCRDNPQAIGLVLPDPDFVMVTSVLAPGASWE